MRSYTNEYKKGRYLKELFDKDGNVISSQNHQFDEWTEPSLIFSKEMRNLEGKLLTLVDATFQDKQQREAQKSVVQRTIWDWWYQYNSIPQVKNNKNELVLPDSN